MFFDDVNWGDLLSGGGGESSLTAEPLAVTQNGNYSAPSGIAYTPVTVSVPNTYAATDEGKVVSSGALVSQTSMTITENGTIDTTLNNEVTVNVSGGGAESAEDEIIMRTISGAYVNNRVTEIGSYAFASCHSLTSVSFPMVTSIGGYAFISCPNLTVVSFPMVASIGGSAFAYCRSLTSVSFPLVTSIGSYAFSSCSNLAFVSFPVITNIGGYAFVSCHSLTSVSFPMVTSIGNNAFASCPNLTSVSFPVTTSIGGNAFASCPNLTSVSFPLATSIGSYAFYRCYNLISLYLTGSSVVTLTNSNAFNSTPIGGYSASAGQYGSIYVPASLLSEYQAATNWAVLSDRFVGIE